MYSTISLLALLAEGRPFFYKHKISSIENVFDWLKIWPSSSEGGDKNVKSIKQRWAMTIYFNQLCGSSELKDGKRIQLNWEMEKITKHQAYLDQLISITTLRWAYMWHERMIVNQVKVHQIYKFWAVLGWGFCQENITTKWPENFHWYLG